MIMIKSCIICTEPFTCSPSDKRVTCGNRACVAERKKQTHTGKHPAWSSEAKARASRRGKTANLQLGTPAAQQSPIAGPFETNQEAKYWRIISPEQKHYEVRNLRKFCRDNAHLFAPNTWQNAYAGLKMVNASLRGKTRRSVGQWKGWGLAQPSEEI
jgi:hypothetical protein